LPFEAQLRRVPTRDVDAVAEVIAETGSTFFLEAKVYKKDIEGQ
jgi:hypothetical protein